MSFPGRLSLVALFSLSSLGSFLFGYLKYGRKLRKILNAGPAITSKDELIQALQSSYKPSFRFPLLGIAYYPSTVLKLTGKVVALIAPRKKTCIIPNGYAKRMILDINVVIDFELVKTNEGFIEVSVG